MNSYGKALCSIGISEASIEGYEEVDKKEMKKQKNRESATKSRNKKKQLLKMTVQRIADINKENLEYSDKTEQIKALIQRVNEETERMKIKINEVEHEKTKLESHLELLKNLYVQNQGIMTLFGQNRVCN